MKKTIRKAFKFRLTPNEDQAQKMLEFSGCSRFLWNKVLAHNLNRLANKSPIFWYQEMSFWTTLWKKSDDYGFLKGCHSQVLQQKLKDLDKAFKDCFDKKQPLKRLPKFKRKGLGDSFRFPQGFKLEQKENKIYLPKIGWVKYRNSQQVIGELRNVTISKKGQHWFVSIQVECESVILPHQSTNIVGLDLGVKRFVTLSDGSYIEPLNSFKQLSKKLAFEQKKLARKVKFSANWKKQKQKITKLHEHIANARHDFLHKASTQISKNHAMIVIEDLKVNNMTRSAKGNDEQHGKNVKAKSGLNRSILDQGWSMFVSFLTYKQDWAGGQVLKVPAHYTSQTCPKCHHVAKENRLTQSQFKCVECAYTENADVVGAVNVLERGHRLLACGVETLVSTVKQELQGSCEACLVPSL
jgi:putative transposase